MCLRHLLPGSGLSGHSSSYDEYAYFFKSYTFYKSKVGTLYQKKKSFFLKNTMHYSDNLLLRCQWWLTVF